MTPQSPAPRTADAAAMRGPKQRSPIGLAATCFLSYRRPCDPAEFLEYANSLGAGGVQMSVATCDGAYLKSLRKRADELGMYIEILGPLPRNGPDAFRRTAATAKEIAAEAIRVVTLSGRRYETFETFAEWKQHEQRARKWIFDAAVIADRMRTPVAIENHKDRTANELAQLLREISSEYVGACLDTGNNISLLEEPMQVIETLAPFALSTHIKDMGLAPAEDGFYLSEMPFGQGILDVGRMIQTIAAARPKTRLTLEMITRDPLHVPCLTAKYQAMLPDRPGDALERTLELARRIQKPLPAFSGLAREEQVKAEEAGVTACLDYARRELSLLMARRTSAFR